MLCHKHSNSRGKRNPHAFCAINGANESADWHALLCRYLPQEVPELLFESYTRRPVVIPNYLMMRVEFLGFAIRAILLNLEDVSLTGYYSAKAIKP
jgi:hypothetical protein